MNPFLYGCIIILSASFFQILSCPTLQLGLKFAAIHQWSHTPITSWFLVCWVWESSKHYPFIQVGDVFLFMSCVLCSYYYFKVHQGPTCIGNLSLSMALFTWSVFWYLKRRNRSIWSDRGDSESWIHMEAQLLLPFLTSEKTAANCPIFFSTLAASQQPRKLSHSSYSLADDMCLGYRVLDPKFSSGKLRRSCRGRISFDLTEWWSA